MGSISWAELIRDLNPDMTQQQIADRYEMAQSTIANIFTGDRFPKLPTQERIAKVEGVKMWELVRRMEEGVAWN